MITLITLVLALGVAVMFAYHANVNIFVATLICALGQVQLTRIKYILHAQSVPFIHNPFTINFFINYSQS